MKQPLVLPKSSDNDPELQALIEFYNETLGFCPNSVKTMHHQTPNCLCIHRNEQSRNGEQRYE